MKVIYIAGPYRASGDRTVEHNVDRAALVAATVVSVSDARVSVLVPHLVGHGVDEAMAAFPPERVPGDAYWLAATLELLRRCDAVVLVWGWEASAGTAAEIAEARALGLPVFETTEALRSWLDSEEGPSCSTC